MAWSTPRSWTAGEVVTAGTMNLHVRDQLNFLGSLLSTGTLATNGILYGSGTVAIGVLGTGADRRELEAWATAAGGMRWFTTLLGSGTGLHTSTVAADVATVNIASGSLDIRDRMRAMIYAHVIAGTMTLGADGSVVGGRISGIGNGAVWDGIVVNGQFVMVQQNWNRGPDNTSGVMYAMSMRGTHTGTGPVASGTNYFTHGTALSSGWTGSMQWLLTLGSMTGAGTVAWSYVLYREKS